jgi:2-keto-3-deoxy-L-rhamnonate aldolase RhmA
MKTLKERIKERINKGQICIGSAVTFSDPLASEVLADEVDFLWYDLEHCPMSYESLNGHMLAARSRSVPSLVRAPSTEIGFIKPVLDSGANGIVVPQIVNAKEVEAVVEYCRYRPLGKRGLGPRVPADYGRKNLNDFVQSASKDIFVSVMIENVEAMEQLERIVSVAGLDSVVIGPADLTSSLGCLCDFENQKFIDAVKKVVAAAKKAGVLVGAGLGADEKFALKLAELGVQWLQFGSDYGYLIKCIRDLKSKL